MEMELTDQDKKFLRSCNIEPPLSDEEQAVQSWFEVLHEEFQKIESQHWEQTTDGYYYLYEEYPPKDDE